MAYEPKQVKLPIAKRPMTIGPLRFGIDIDGTISQAPRHFKKLIDALLDRQNEVYIITGRPENERPKTEVLLRCLGIRYTDLLMRPVDWTAGVPEFKVVMVQEKRVDIMIDDDEMNCWAIEQETEALAAHMLPIPEMADAARIRDQVRAEEQRQSWKGEVSDPK